MKDNNKKIKIGVFAYNWPHLKTQSGLFNLMMAGIKPEIVIAADPVNLKFYKSKVRLAPRGLYLHNTQDICESFNINFEVVKHNSQKCENLIKKYNLDLGIVLGARILKSNIIDCFKIGVLNLHPGILPENRGLDTIKWAILKDLPQGVTSHMINEKIDMGTLINKQKIKVYSDDTLTDIYMRIQSLEQEMMIDAIKNISEGNIESFLKLDSGKNYHRSVPPEIEDSLHEAFIKYKINRGI